MAGPTNANTGRTSSPTRPAPARRAAPAAAPRSAAQTAAAGVPAPVVVAPAATPAVATPALAVPAPAPHTTPVNLQAGPAPAPRDGQGLLYGLIVVVTGFVAILIALCLVLINTKVGDSATATLGIITTAIAGLGGAFFGVTVGQQGTASANRERAAAETAKDAAQMRTIKFAAYLDPAVGRRLVE